MNREEIMKILPHRDDMLLLDDVSKVEGEAIEIEFEINLTKNIKEIKKIDLFNYFIKDDVIYHLTYYFNCPEDNEVFYSKDGKLYYKSDDSLAIS